MTRQVNKRSRGNVAIIVGFFLVGAIGFGAVVIDLASPHVSIYRIGRREIEVDATDTVWDGHELTMRYRFDRGAWSEAGHVVPIELPAPTAVDMSVELEVEESRFRLDLFHNR